MPLTQPKQTRAAVERALSPGYSTCLSCRRPWRFVEGHVTDYKQGRGCFPLCEACWAALGTPEARLPYYRQMWMEWLDVGLLPPASREEHLRELLDETWPAIKAAVMEGR